MKATTASRLRWGLLTFVTLIAATLLLGYCMATSRPDGNPPEVTVIIPKGATRDDVMARLAAAHLAERPWVTALVFRIKGVFANLRAGVYKVPGDANALELADLLANGEPGQRVTVTIIPGQSVWELADRVAAAGAGTRDEVVTLAADRAWVAAELARAGGPALAPRAARSDGIPTPRRSGKPASTHRTVPWSTSKPSARRRPAPPTSRSAPSSTEPSPATARCYAASGYAPPPR